MVLVIRSSAVDRLGVFTTRPIKKGEYVCGYGDQNVDSASPYAMKFPDGSLRGGVRPTAADNVPHMCGFMMNDANMITMVHTETDKFTLPKLRAAVTAYILNSRQNSNVVFVGYNGDLYAKRDIDADEELFLHYGHDYWLSRLMHDYSVYPYVRFLCIVERVDRDPTGDGRRGLMGALRDPELASRFVRDFLEQPSRRRDDLAYLQYMYKYARAGGA